MRSAKAMEIMSLLYVFVLGSFYTTLQVLFETPLVAIIFFIFFLVDIRYNIRVPLWKEIALQRKAEHFLAAITTILLEFIYL